MVGDESLVPEIETNIEIHGYLAFGPNRQNTNTEILPPPSTPQPTQNIPSSARKKGKRFFLFSFCMHA